MGVEKWITAGGGTGGDHLTVLEEAHRLLRDPGPGQRGPADPRIILWAELAVLAHLTGRTIPFPDREFAGRLRHCHTSGVLVFESSQKAVREEKDGRHPRSAECEQAYGRSIPGGSCARRLAAVRRWYEDGQRDAAAISAGRMGPAPCRPDRAGGQRGPAIRTGRIGWPPAAPVPARLAAAASRGINHDTMTAWR